MLYLEPDLLHYAVGIDNLALPLRVAQFRPKNCQLYKKLRCDVADATNTPIRGYVVNGTFAEFFK
jgi:hypothetical protein